MIVPELGVKICSFDGARRQAILADAVAPPGFAKRYEFRKRTADPYLSRRVGLSAGAQHEFLTHETVCGKRYGVSGTGP